MTTPSSATPNVDSSARGGFSRDTNYIATRITDDGHDGYPVDIGRYRLVVSRACPWANRAIIVRRLLGLEWAISMGVAPRLTTSAAGTSSSIRRPRSGARHRAPAGGVPRA